MEAHSDLLTVARERFDSRDYRGAALLLASAIESGQAYADAYHLLGMCHALLDQREEALRAFEGALERNPRYVEAHLNRAIILGDLGRSAEAEAALAMAQELGRPDATGYPAMVGDRLASLHAELGRAYREAGVLQAAVAQFRSALALRPAFADVGLELARALIESGQLTEATLAVEEVQRVRPGWLDAMLLQGLAAYLAGDLERADSLWADAASRHPDNPTLETYRSMLARRLGEQR